MNPSVFSKTPALAVFDSRGLRVRDVAYHRHPEAMDETRQLITRHGFTAQGFPASSADPRLHEAGLENCSWVSDLSGKVLSATSTDAGVTLILHDATGRPCEMFSQMRSTDAAADGQSERVTRTWQYEESGLRGRALLIAEAGPEGEPRVLERFTYAGSSPAEQALNLAGQCVCHHDTAGLLQTDSVALTGVPLSITRYLMAGAENPETTVDWSQPGALNRDLVFTTRSLSDATGQVIGITDAKGNEQRSSYDLAGQLVSCSLTMGDGSRQILIRSVTYSAAGQKLCETHGNGLVTRNAYDAMSQRLASIRIERPAGHRAGAKLLQALHYEYDPVGNVLAMRDDAQTVRFWRNQKVEPVDTYGYDSLYRLIVATGREMANAGRHSGGRAPLVAWDDATWTHYSRRYSYDNSGNLTRIRHCAPASGHSYSTDIIISERSNRGVTSDLADQPAQVDDLFTPGGQQALLQPGQALHWTGRGELCHVAAVTRVAASDDAESYRYGSDRQRVLKVSRHQSASVEHMRRTLYLPNLELRHYSRDDAEVEDLQVVSLEAPDCARIRLLRWNTGKPDAIDNDQVRYGYGNLQGSISLEVDGHGRVISQESYFPYGGTSMLMAENSVEVDYRTVRYSGKERDATGLYYYGYRYYQTWAGRWLSVDPAGDIDGLNLFGFCHGNPLSQVDRFGAVGVPVSSYPDVNLSYWGLTRHDIAQDWAGFYRSQNVTPQMLRGDASRVVAEQTRSVMLDLDPERYNARFRPATQHRNEQSLIERESIGRIYRLDWNAPGEMLNSGFRASSDFSAVENMLHGELPHDDDSDSDNSSGSSAGHGMSDDERRREQQTLIVSTEITGVDHYTRVTQARGYLYEIDATGITGVSLTDNLINNSQGLVRFFDGDHPELVTRESAYRFLSNFGVDIELEEAHVDVAQLNEAIRRNPDRVNFVHRYR